MAMGTVRAAETRLLTRVELKTIKGIAPADKDETLRRQLSASYPEISFGHLFPALCPVTIGTMRLQVLEAGSISAEGGRDRVEEIVRGLCSAGIDNDDTFQGANFHDAVDVAGWANKIVENGFLNNEGVKEVRFPYKNHWLGGKAYLEQNKSLMRWSGWEWTQSQENGLGVLYTLDPKQQDAAYLGLGNRSEQNTIRLFLVNNKPDDSLTKQVYDLFRKTGAR